MAVGISGVGDFVGEGTQGGGASADTGGDEWASGGEFDQSAFGAVATTRIIYRESARAGGAAAEYGTGGFTGEQELRDPTSETLKERNVYQEDLDDAQKFATQLPQLRQQVADGGLLDQCQNYLNMLIKQMRDSDVALGPRPVQ